MHPTFAEQVIKTYDAQIPLLHLIILARLYVQDVYCQLRITADTLRVERDKLVSQEDPHWQMVDL